MQVRGDIAFRDVRFRHAGRSAWTLDGVSFSIDAGSTVALVGPSGSGALLAAADLVLIVLWRAAHQTLFSARSVGSQDGVAVCEFAHTEVFSS